MLFIKNRLQRKKIYNALLQFVLVLHQIQKAHQSFIRLKSCINIAGHHFEHLL